jgi:hypothetical protein
MKVEAVGKGEYATHHRDRRKRDEDEREEGESSGCNDGFPHHLDKVVGDGVLVDW